MFSFHKKECEQHKIIHDVMHGFIPMSKLAINIIDSSLFQRLRNLKQLGVCNFIFPNAVHTRFEHSLGTYFLADKLLKAINETIDPKYLNSIEELKPYFEKYNKDYTLDDYIIELVKIAALCHDLGHGAFSHLFDDIILVKNGMSKCKESKHETRSGLIIEMIIKNSDYLSNIITNNEILFIKNIINPDINIHKGFLYEIVSNCSTGIDVDKIDYIMRDQKIIFGSTQFQYERLVSHIKVIDNTIIYPEQALYDIYELFMTRYRMHKQIYCHRGVIAIQECVIKLFVCLDKILGLSNSIYDMNKFCEIDDNYIMQATKFLNITKKSLNEEQLLCLDEATKIMKDITTHNIYTIIGSFASRENIDIDEYFVGHQNVLCFKSKIGFVSGDKPNPLEKIKVYSSKNNKVIVNKTKNDISYIIPDVYQEYLYMVFYTGDDADHINKLKNIFDGIS
jgi:HD superfamily phosphohydrolase